MSILCPKCNKNLKDGTKFCYFCGSKISAGGIGSGFTPPPQGGGGTIPPELTQYVVDSREQMMGKLENSVMKTFVTSGEFGKNIIFFTEKRFYAKQNRFSMLKGLIRNDFIVDIKKISGTSVFHINPISRLIWAAILLLISIILILIGQIMPSAIGFILTIFVMVSYFLKKGTYLRIAYAGDTTDLAVKMYPYHTVLKFHKKLRAVIEG